MEGYLGQNLRFPRDRPNDTGYGRCFCSCSELPHTPFDPPLAVRLRAHCANVSYVH